VDVGGASASTALRAVEEARRKSLLARGHEPEVALGQRDLRPPRERAERPGVTASGEGLAQPGHVSLAADPIEDDTGQIERRIELLGPEHDGSGAPHLGARVHHEHDREPQVLGDRSRARRLASPVEAVEEPHDALDEDEVSVVAAPGERCPQALGRQHPAIERSARSPGDRLVESRVNEVGPDLGAADTEAAPPERRRQGQRDGGLADRRGEPGNAKRSNHDRRSETPASLNVAISV
jgi:hypothetical protein